MKGAITSFTALGPLAGSRLSELQARTRDLEGPGAVFPAGQLAVSVLDRRSTHIRNWPHVEVYLGL